VLTQNKDLTKCSHVLAKYRSCSRYICISTSSSWYCSPSSRSEPWTHLERYAVFGCSLISF